MTPTPETLMTPDEVEAGVAARLAAYTRGQRRGPLTGDVYLWAYGAALAGWRADRKRLEAAESARHMAEAKVLGRDAIIQQLSETQLAKDVARAERWIRAAKELMNAEGVYTEEAIEATAVMLEDAALAGEKP